jgi:hypothetical protein
VRGVQTKQLASARFDETIWTHMVRSHRQGPCYCCALRCPGVPWGAFLLPCQLPSMPAGSRTDQGDGVGSPAPTPLPKTVRAKLDRTSQGSCCRGHPLHHHFTTFLLHGTRSNTPALHLTMHASIEPVASGIFHFSRLPWHGLKTEPTKQHACLSQSFLSEHGSSVRPSFLGVQNTLMPWRFEYNLERCAPYSTPPVARWDCLSQPNLRPAMSPRDPRAPVPKRRRGA